MLVYIELVVPLMVFLKIFSLPSFLAVLILTKLLFIKYYYHQDPKEYLVEIRNKVLIFLYDLLDEPSLKFRQLEKSIFSTISSYIHKINYCYLLKRTLFLAVFIYLIYLLGYRCFISLANPLPETSYFFEWVADLNLNILYTEDKVVKGELFYGLSIFIFVLKIFTNIDPIILFNIYPFAIASLLIYGAILLASLLGEYVATWITTTTNPDFINLWGGFRIYQIPSHYFDDPTLYLEKISMNPYIRYFSGTAYELSSTLFLLNLFYLIKLIDKGYPRYLYNYTFSLLLIFIFHPKGSFALTAPVILIFLNALFSWKLNLSLLTQIFKALLIAVLVGNLWVLAAFKYEVLPQFLAFEKESIKKVELGIEEVTISHLTFMHLFLFLSSLLFFFLARVLKKPFYFSSFLLIPLGFFLLFYAENLGFLKLIHPLEGVTYLYLSVSIIISCYIKLMWIFLKKVLGKLGKIIFISLVSGVLFISLFVIPSYKDIEFFKRFINGVQYSEIPLKLYQIVKQNRPMSWTVVSYVQEYSKVKGRGFMINSSDFLLDYSPLDKEIPIPTQKIYIFVEDIPHRYRGKNEWFYRWRRDIQDRLKEWIGVYASTHDNIKLYSQTKLLSVYEIDNSGYLQRLKKESDANSK